MMENISVTPVKNCWGWESINEAASDIFSSIHSSLLNGSYVFGYKNTSGSDKTQLMQVIVVRFDRDVFGVGAVTTGYTMLLPQVPLRYLKTVLLDDLKKWKVESEIVETFNQIIKDIENEITRN